MSVRSWVIDSVPVRAARGLAVAMCVLSVLVLAKDFAVMMSADQPEVSPVVVDGSREAGTA